MFDNILQLMGLSVTSFITLTVLVLLFWGSFFVIKQQDAGIVERLGKFNRIVGPGFHFKIPLIESVFKQSLRTRELNVNVDSKTSDNVFVELTVSVQYKVPNNKDKIYKSVYELESPEKQMESYIFDIVRSEVPKLSIDEIFNEKGLIAQAIKKEVGSSLEEYGYEIVQTLITDIKVDEKIQQAMNDIVASEREKQAVIQRSESKKIEMIKAAEAEAEAKKLQGQGIASQREEIIKGFKNSIEALKEANIDEKEILSFVLLTQYFDTLKDVAASPSNTIMLPGSPKGFLDFSETIREAMISSLITADKTKDKTPKGENKNV